MPEKQEAAEVIPQHRFCVTYLERMRVDKPKTREHHSFFTAIDQGDAETQFWNTPIWKPPVKKIEIVSIEEV